MSEEETIDYFKKILFQTIQANECGLSNNDFKKEIKCYETILDIIEKQKEKERNLKKVLMEQDELIEKLSRELHNKNKRKIYIRRAKNEI